MFFRAFPSRLWIARLLGTVFRLLGTAFRLLGTVFRLLGTSQPSNRLILKGKKAFFPSKSFKSFKST